MSPHTRARGACCTLAALMVMAACQPAAAPPLSAAQKQAIADTLEQKIAAAYDLSKPGVVQRMMSLYPDSGPVISAAAGRVTTSRDSLEAELQTFWKFVGSNMRDPRWVWEKKYVEVLSPTAAVLTATYHIPHIQPNGMPHDLAGAWTALFERRNGKWVIVQEHLSDVPMPAM